MDHHIFDSDNHNMQSATSLPFDARAFAVLAAYLCLCLCVGAAGFSQRRHHREESVQDHFLAGTKGLPMAVLIGTLLAQTLSGWALLGYPAAAFREACSPRRRGALYSARLSEVAQFVSFNH